MKYKSRMEK
uniref:Uncharacterized protein n=1 Tax=Anguilla anguilla TaxID=7936 RepID=A0A0E9UU08_ANGAN